jgi:hypothetical protein
VLFFESAGNKNITLAVHGLEEHFRLGGICVVVSMYNDYWFLCVTTHKRISYFLMIPIPQIMPQMQSVLFCVSYDSYVVKATGTITDRQNDKLI